MSIQQQKSSSSAFRGEGSHGVRMTVAVTAAIKQSLSHRGSLCYAQEKSWTAKKYSGRLRRSTGRQAQATTHSEIRSERQVDHARPPCHCLSLVGKRSHNRLQLTAYCIRHIAGHRHVGSADRGTTHQPVLEPNNYGVCLRRFFTASMMPRHPGAPQRHANARFTAAVCRPS